MKNVIMVFAAALIIIMALAGCTDKSGAITTLEAIDSIVRFN